MDERVNPEPRDEEPANEEPEICDPEIGDSPVRTWRWPSFRLAGRPSAAGTMISILVGLLGFAMVVQLKGSSSDEQLANARPDDLVRILADLDSRKERLRQELDALEERRRQLQSGARGQAAALAELKRRADELGILAGTLPAQGSGLHLVITPGSQQLKASTLLDAVQELRGAGAEAMQIRSGDGTAVRVVASTYFVDQEGSIGVDGVKFVAPYSIDVIGDPQTMQTAMNIPGGVTDSLRQYGGNVQVETSNEVNVLTLHSDNGLKYAKPTS